MGQGYSLGCKRCGYKISANLGVGFAFPRVYEAVMKEAQDGKLGKTVQSFLEGIFYQDYDAPEVEYMEKEFFESTQDGIEMDIDSGIVRDFYEMKILSFMLEDVDNSYSPKEAAYKCIYSYDFKYWPQGRRGTGFRTNGCRAARFFFERQDDRWVLYGWKDMGVCDAPENESIL